MKAAIYIYIYKLHICIYMNTDLSNRNNEPPLSIIMCARK